jgi:transcriptional regulator with XRE-family HTH domain
MAQRGKGKTYQWLLAHKDYPHKDWCLVWPFARDKHGRGIMGHEGRSWWAHRFMCTIVKGEPPTPQHTAAHSCGNGHGGCINPWHLDWKTQAENMEDCRVHGTLIRHHGGNVRRLLPEEIKAIRDARHFQTQGQLAAKFGISEGTVSDIWHNRSHVGVSKINHWSPEEDAKLTEAIGRGLTHKEAAAIVGRPHRATATRAARIGLKSQWVPPAPIER